MPQCKKFFVSPTIFGFIELLFWDEVADLCTKPQFFFLVIRRRDDLIVQFLWIVR